MLLEEVILRFLEVNGYSALDGPGDDPTLDAGPSGMMVRGRGSLHQIDAIANYRFTPPFSYPYRLLVEAKSLSKPVGLEVIRNALGVLRDVSEYWQDPQQPRFHYQYAVFTETSFTRPAQDFAYVQDIFLLPLARATSMASVLEALRSIRSEDLPEAGDRPVALGTLRHAFRACLRETGDAGAGRPELEFAQPLINATRQVGQALIGMTLNGLPLFLVAAPDVDVTTLDDQIVRIRSDDESWYLEDQDGQRLFTFDLPEQLFDLYAKRGRLTDRSALNLKEGTLSEIHATVFHGQHARLVRFLLDRQWTERVRERIKDRGPRRRAK